MKKDFGKEEITHHQNDINVFSKDDDNDDT